MATHPPINLLTHLQQTTCNHTTPDLEQPHITAYTATLSTTPIHNGPTKVGFLQLQLLAKAALEADNAMWQACHTYDNAHSPEAKLHKVENYLSNECFHADKQLLLDSATCVLYIEKVFLKAAFRGKGLGLRAVQEVIRELGVGGKCVVLLEPGPITVGEVEADEDGDGVSAVCRGYREARAALEEDGVCGVELH